MMLSRSSACSVNNDSYTQSVGMMVQFPDWNVVWELDLMQMVKVTCAMMC